jgi:Viral BACON domain/Matrixin/Putative binding domain, N-terminal
MAFSVRRLRRVAVFLAVCAICTVPDRGWASTVLYRTDAQLIAMSERVVHGRVISQRTTKAGPDGQTIYTVTTLQIIEDLTGVFGAAIEIWELGGTFGDETLYVGGAVEYRIGEDVLVCLERGPNGFRSVSMGFSKFDVVAQANGQRTLRRNMRDTAVVGGGAAVVRDRTLSEFRDLAAQVTGRQAQAGVAPPQGEPRVPVAQPFTLLGGGFRWAQADSGTPVSWYKNTTAPPPLDGGLDGVSQIQTSLAAWTNPTSASIILQYAGTTSQSAAKGPWTGIPSNSGVITFEDPNGEMSGGTLAIGGGWSGGAVTTVNGTTFAGFSRAYVIFADGLSGQFRQSLGFTRVLEHEIGHAIGLGHSDQGTSNIMYPSCCHSETPVPPALGADDLAGLNFIYPQTGQSCTYSINPTSVNVPFASNTGTVQVTTQAGCTWGTSGGSGFITVTSGATGNGSGQVGYSVAANGVTTARTGTLTIAGRTFTVNQAAGPCAFTLNPTQVVAPAGGTSGVLSVSTASNCNWTASSSPGFVTLVPPTTGTGNGTVAYNVSANGVSTRSGQVTVNGQTLTINQLGTGPAVSLSPTQLNFGATITGTTVTAQTTSQPVRLTQAPGPAVSWTASSNQSWLTISPTSGSGSQTFMVSVNPAGLGASGQLNATITFNFTGAGSFAGPVNVTLRLMPTGTSTNPIGVVDTPANNTTGVVGAIPVTGWALDDTEIAMVNVCRTPVAGESVGADGRCGNAVQVYVGEGVFVDGARPDVMNAFPTYPRSTRGGWGFMVLTNMLPSQGNGTYTLHAYGIDRELRTTLLGSRTIICNNAQATRPFGAIDTPAQGGTVSGASYVNFGWALTPMPKTIPIDGSTFTVFVDGVSLGGLTYNQFRSDIATLFPGYNNSSGAVGFKVINTTNLTDGLHTISWVVTDNQGASEGIGSRYFTVANGSGSMTTAEVSAAALDTGVSAPVDAAALDTVAVDRSAVGARRGWDPSAPWRGHAAGGSGRVVVRAEEIGRVELDLGLAGDVTGYLRAGDALQALPVGSQLNGRSGHFTWAPGVGFVGPYDFTFVRRADGRPVARKDVRIVLHAKGSGFVGPQVVIDTPRSQMDVAQPFVLAGWAADLKATDDTGVSAIHVWAYPLAGGPPVFLGAGAYGGARPDVAAVHGDHMRDSGFGLFVQGLAPGNYDLAVFAWSTELADFAPAQVVRVTVR